MPTVQSGEDDIVALARQQKAAGPDDDIVALARQQKAESPDIWEYPVRLANATKYDAFLMNRPGETAAKSMVAGGVLDQWKLLFPAVSGKIPTAADIEAAANNNDNPSADRVRRVWETLKSRQAESVALAKALHGDKPNWDEIGKAWQASQGEGAEAAVRVAVESGAVKPSPRGKKPAEKLDPRGPPVINIGDKFKQQKPPMVVEGFEETDFDRQLAEVAKGARGEPVPGVSRPPLSDEEIAAAAMLDLEDEIASKIAELPVAVRGVMSGMGNATRNLPSMAAGGLIAKGVGGLGPTAVAAAEGAAGSLADQLVQMGTGARKEIMPSEIIRDAALLGLGSKAGRALAARFPDSAPIAQSIAASVGALGTLKAGQTLMGATPAPREGKSGTDAFIENLISDMTVVAGSAPFGIGAPKDRAAPARRGAKPAASEPVRVAETAQAAQRAATAPDAPAAVAAPDAAPQAEAAPRPAEASTQPAAEAPAPKGPKLAPRTASFKEAEMSANALKETIAAKLGRTTNYRKISQYKNEATARTLEAVIDTLDAKTNYLKKRNAAAGKDAELLQRIEDAVTAKIESGDKSSLPIPEGVDAKTFDELVDLKLKFAKRNLPFGKMLMEDGRVPEGTYRHDPPPPDKLAQMTDAEMLGAIRDSYTAKAPDQKSYPHLDEEALANERPDAVRERLLNEMARRISFAKNPEAVAEMYLEYAKNNPAGDDTSATGAPVFEFDVEGQLSRAIHLGGSRARTFGVEPSSEAGAPLTITKQDFDAGKLPDVTLPSGRVIEGMKVSREAAKRGEYGKLVGGYKFHEDRGFFMPRSTMYQDASGQWTSTFDTPRSGDRAPGRNQLAAKHLKRRTQDFEEAFRTRELDTSVESMFEVIMSEDKMIKDITFLKAARRDGEVLRDADLPDSDVRMQARLEREDLIRKRAQIQRRLRVDNTLTPEQATALKDEAAIAGTRILQLKAIADGKYYVQAEGKDWGEFEGMWMAPWVKRQVELGRDVRGQAGKLYDAIHTGLKKLRVSTNVPAALGDLFGNYISSHFVGHPPQPADIARALDVEVRNAPKNRIDQEFDALVHSNGSALGGPGEISSRELNTTTGTDMEIADRQRQGLPTLLARIRRVVETPGSVAGRAAKKLEKVPVLGTALRAASATARGLEWLGDKKTKFSDRSMARAVYYKLRRDGYEPTDAFHIVTRMMDYRTLGRGVHIIARFASMLRYPAKVGEQIGMAMEQPVSVFGKRMWTPFDEAIKADPTSPRAQRALIGRGLTRLAVASTKYLAPIAATAFVARKALGISKDEIDKAIDRKYEYLPWHVRKLMKMTAIPYGRDKDGFVQIIDASRYFPAMVAMRYFWINFDDSKNEKGLDRAAREFFGKNVGTGPAWQAASGRNFAGDFTSEDEPLSPGGRWWPLVEAITPAIINTPIQAYFEYERVPEEERSALMTLARRGLGLPLQVLRNRGAMQAVLEKLYADELIGVEPREDGSWNYYPKKPAEDPEGAWARQVLQAAERYNEARPGKKLSQIKRKLEQLEAIGD